MDPLIKAMQAKRTAEGLSIRALSDRVGISFSALARLERGIGMPDNSTKARIANWLGDEAEGLFEVEQVTQAHFRVSSNIPARTIDCLAAVAEAVRSRHSYSALGKRSK